MAFAPSWTDRVDLFSPVPSLALGSPRPPSSAVFADSPAFALDSPASTASITSFGPRDEYPLDSPPMVVRRGAFSRDMTPELSPEPTHRSTFGSPAGREGQADKRRSVRPAKDTLVNWSWPLQAKAEASELSLFGASLQRNRRLRERISVPLESPASSCDEHIVTPAPSTPTSEVNSLLMSSPELSPLAFRLTGLGFKGVDALDALESQVVDSPKRPKPSKPSANSQPSTSRTVFEVSDSLRHLSTPTTLEELQSLRAAAWELEAEARRPFRSTPATTNSPVMHTPHTPHTPEASGSRPKREKRIRRKAVPVISEDLSRRVLPFSTETPVMRSIIPDIVPPRASSEGSACADDEEDDAHDDDHLDVFLSCPSSPAMRPREFGLRQGMYTNRLGTMSAIEVSSRQSAIRFAAPPKAMPMPPVPESLERGDVGYASTSTLSDHLATPTRVSSSSSRAGEAHAQAHAQAHGKAGSPGGIYRSKNAFMSMLDLGLTKVAAQEGQKPAPSDEKKQRRGLAKLLKRR